MLFKYQKIFFYQINSFGVWGHVLSKNIVSGIKWDLLLIFLSDTILRNKCNVNDCNLERKTIAIVSGPVPV